MILRLKKEETGQEGEKVDTPLLFKHQANSIVLIRKDDNIEWFKIPVHSFELLEPAVLVKRDTLQGSEYFIDIFATKRIIDFTIGYMEIRHTVSRDSPQDPGKETDTYKIFIFGIYKDECDCMIGVSLVARKETGETTVQTHQDFLAARTIRKNQSVVSLMINLPTDTISIDIIDPDELLLDHKPSNYFSKLTILESKGILLEFDAELEVYRESSPENAWDKYHLKSCTVSKDGSVALKSDANPFNGKQDTETGIQYQARH